MGEARPGADNDFTPPGLAESSREIARLRFADRDVERAFHEFHIVRCLPTYRILFLFVLGFQVVLLATAPLLEGLELSDPRMYVRAAFGLTQGTLGLWAIRQLWFLRWGEIFMAMQPVVIGLMLASVFFARHPLGFARMAIYLVSAVFLCRLRVFHAVAIITFLTTAYGFLASVQLPATDRELLPSKIGQVALSGLLLAVAAYMLEHSERRDFLLTRLLGAEQRKSERLLLNVLPPSIAHRLRDDENAQVAEGYDEVTVLFADIPEFTPNAARFGPRAVVRVLNDVYSRFDEIGDRHGLEKIKTVGDAYMAVAGAPERRADHASMAVSMALEMIRIVREFRWPGDEPLTLRIGLASGPAVAGVIGRRKFSYDLWGDTVNVASRLSGVGEPGTIVMTEHTYALVDGKVAPATPANVVVKGKGRMRVFVLDPALKPVHASTANKKRPRARSGATSPST